MRAGHVRDRPAEILGLVGARFWAAHRKGRSNSQNADVTGFDDERSRAIVRNLKPCLALIEPDSPLPLLHRDRHPARGIDRSDGSVRQRNASRVAITMKE